MLYFQGLCTSSLKCNKPKTWRRNLVVSLNFKKVFEIFHFAIYTQPSEVSHRSPVSYCYWCNKRSLSFSWRVINKYLCFIFVGRISFLEPEQILNWISVTTLFGNTPRVISASLDLIVRKIESNQNISFGSFQDDALIVR